jgi:replicative DNA helicase
MSDLKESGDIEQDADIIMFIGKTQEDGVSKITVAKHRHAPIGDCYLLHRGEYSRFEAMAKGYEPKQEPKGKLDRWV